MKRIITAFARNRVFANIIMVLIILSGLIASFSMVKQNEPDVNLDIITVGVPFPGADPEEVEEGICRKIESAIDGLEGIKQYTTIASENYGSATIEVKYNYDLEKVLDDVQTRIEGISTFPLDAEKPIVDKVRWAEGVILLSLSGDMSERRIKEWAERVKDDIQSIPEISQVQIGGTRAYEIGIEVSEERLREYGLTFTQVANAIRQSNLNLAGGTIRTEGEEIRVRTVGRKYTGKELASIVVKAYPNGEMITLDRIAFIDDGFTENSLQTLVNGEPAVFMNISKIKGEDSLAISEAVHRYVEKQQPQIPAGAKLSILFDATDMLHDRINLLVKNGIIGLFFVFLSLWAFLDFRLSFWVGIGIPISFAGGLVVLWASGGNINQMSLFGLIMVLGIIVDDAIVVGESIYVHRKQGSPPLKAAVEGLSEVALPVIASVVTTVIAFIPLAFIPGTAGQFISVLPIVVIACLIFSLIECLTLLPAHLNHLPDPNQTNRTTSRIRKAFFLLNDLTGRAMEWFVARVYAPFLMRTLKWRYISMCVAVSILMLAIGLILGGIIKVNAMPEMDGFIITANVRFPDGTPIEVTRDAVQQLDDAFTRLSKKTKTLSGEPLAKHRLWVVGSSINETTAGYGPHFGGIQVILQDEEDRGIHSQEILAAWEKEVGAIPGVTSMTFQGMSAGPPGSAIEVWLRGNHMEDIMSAAENLKERLGHYDGVYQIRSDHTSGKNELRLKLKPEATPLGLTVSDLARQVYAGFYGYEALRLQRGRDDIRIRVRYTADERTRVSDLERMRIRTPNGREVPLLSVADISFEQGYSKITRTNGSRRVMVSADVDNSRANANEILSDLGVFFNELENRYPGLKVDLQGEQEKMRDALGSLYIGYPLAIFGIFTIMATIFRSYAQPFIIITVVPFGIIGGIFGHLVFGYNLSLLSFFGMVALTGVVVNDAIILIERINQNLASGLSFFDAVIQGGARRFRPIFLTTISTVGGMAPLILETDFQAKMVIPMALAMAAGLIFATVITLLLIPSLLVILNDFRLLAHRLRYGTWLKRAEVEPARFRDGNWDDASPVSSTPLRTIEP